MSAAIIHPETVHPSLWRASQLARSGLRTVDTGYAALSAELPGEGWPLGRGLNSRSPFHVGGESGECKADARWLG